MKNNFFTIFCAFIFSLLLTSSSFAAITKADDATFEEAVINSKGVVLVDFWAPWCGPCKRQSKELDKLAAEMPNLRIVKVNVDESPDISNELDIRSIPTLLIVKDGEVVERWSAVTPVVDLKKKLNSYK